MEDDPREKWLAAALADAPPLRPEQIAYIRAVLQHHQQQQEEQHD